MGDRNLHLARLAGIRRVLIHAFPARSPQAVVLLDVGQRDITTFMAEELDRARETLADYDVIAGVDVRALLQRLGVDPGERRLGKLGPP